MSKNYFICRHCLWAFALFFITTIIISSCKKDTDKNGISSIHLVELQNWYKLNSNKTLNSRFETMTPIWQDIFINDQGDHIVYELNLQNPGIRAFNLSYDIAYALAKGGEVILSLNDKSVNDQERDTTNPGYTGTKCP